jgi:hypothetical protein
LAFKVSSKAWNNKQTKKNKQIELSTAPINNKLTTN